MMELMISACVRVCVRAGDFVAVTLFAVASMFSSGVAWAVPSSSNCTNSDAPITVPSPANTVVFCTFETAPSVPASGWVCDVQAVCPNLNTDAAIVYHSGDQWVAWVDCDRNGVYDDCEVLPRTEVSGNPETEGLYLVGNAAENHNRFQFFSGVQYDLQPVPGYGDVISAYSHGLGDVDELWGSDAAANYTEYLYGGDGADRLFGKNGDDFLFGNGDGDTIEGNNGNDRVEGGAGVDFLSGGNGDDIIYGGSGADKITGGDGHDRIDPGDGDDLVCGDNYGGSWASFTCIDGTGDGDDQVRESSGDDSVWGQGAKDDLCDSDADSLRGGSGDDEVYHDGSFAVLDCGADVDKVNVGTGAACESVTLNACPYMNW
jgi:Ca2+-binding RTX toxin-like protein